MIRARRWAVGVGALALIAGGTAIALRANEDVPCGAESVTPLGPLLDPAGMREQPDERLDTLATAVGEMRPPFGDIRAGVGYDYDQWLRLSGLASGLLASTRNSAVLTLLDDESLRPRWSLRPVTKRVAWDASADRFLLLSLDEDAPTQVSSYRLRDGAQRWCVSLASAQSDGEPVSTAVLDDGDVVVALPGNGDAIALARLGGGQGTQRWRTQVDTVSRADYLGPYEDGFVAGGVEEYRLAEADPSAPAGPAITVFDAEDGRARRTYDVPAGTLLHVVGVEGDQIVAVTRSRTGVEFRAYGGRAWSVVPRDGAFESTLRSGVLITRSRTGLTGYDAASGTVRWHRSLDTGRTVFPYGFTLAQMPSLDAGHVLMPTTTALEILDVATGSSTRYPLPTDGVSTTYWPYQLAVSPGLIGIVTNTGGVVVDRD